MAQPTRDRYFDLLRVLAIGRVSVFHMFPFVVLELAFPSMGVMFALAGSLMANSLSKQPNPLRVIYGRVRRLLPALWALAAVVVPAMFLVGWENKPPLWHLITWLIPFADPPSSTFGLQAAEVLWYLVTYLWLVLLSPVLLWLYQRARLATVLLPIALMAALTVWPIWPAPAVEEVGTDLLVFAACWIIGFAHRDGTLRRIPAMVVIPVAVACVAGGLYWSHTHPDAGGLKYIPVAYAFYNVGFVLALLRWSPSMQWLERRPGLTKWVSLINARAVTIYLWNNIAIAFCFAVGDVFEVWRLGRFFEVGYAVIALVLLANAVLMFGWVEDLAARRKPRFLPWPASASTAAAEPRRDTSPAAPAVPVSPAPAMADTAELVGAAAEIPAGWAERDTATGNRARGGGLTVNAVQRRPGAAAVNRAVPAASPAHRSPAHGSAAPGSGASGSGAPGSAAPGSRARGSVARGSVAANGAAGPARGPIGEHPARAGRGATPWEQARRGPGVRRYEEITEQIPAQPPHPGSGNRPQTPDPGRR
ncbi:acyltransferase family protein [Paractinoplanes toevensis]|uniref:Acyltransferase 3 domain-containing protein n=1 Tax=Paractinoplanes toevensis TaxID=571911 RepID=A0A919TGX2_9ACTN|nr:acyltransferase [Actinoplanes toevensis]GIM94947.1 hypothetical protein Ato02nite_067400 [Actinoplanes toevensis]